jgi:hypothetical protein
MTDEDELPRAIKGKPDKATGPFQPATAKATPVRTQIEMPAGMPVATLRFVKPTQVPGMAVTPTLQSHTAKNKRRWDIEFIPQIRHFKITYTPPEPGGAVRTLMVQETRVDTWDPAQ